MYQLGRRIDNRDHHKRRWLFAAVVLVVLILVAVVLLILWIKPKTTIRQSASHTTVISLNGLQHYDEKDFGIDLPVSWQEVSRPIGTNQDYAWQSNVQATDGQVLELYEDNLPSTFPVTHLLIVTAKGDQLALDGTSSPNCNSFTPKSSPGPSGHGVSTSWQGVNFLCDEVNAQRDITGASSSQGINTVSLKSPTTGVVHKFFFTYINYVTNPNYTVFYNALKSLRVK
jgi:hypothetical protein